VVCNGDLLFYIVDRLCWQLSDSKLFVAIYPEDVISDVDNHVYLFHGIIAWDTMISFQSWQKEEFDWDLVETTEIASCTM